MTEKLDNERRRSRRFRLRVPITVLGASDQPASRDLSEGGMFIETGVPHAVGVVLPVRLVHPDTGEVIPAVCQVVRQVRDEAGHLLGLGLRFANADERLGERIRGLIQDLVEGERDEERDDAGELDNDDWEPDDDREPDDDDREPGDLDGEAETFDDEDDADAALAVVEFDDPDLTWESDNDGGEVVDVLVVEANISDGGQRHSAVPIIWPDTTPEKIPGALRHGLTPMQLRLLAFIDGNNTVEEVAEGAGLGLEVALAELSDLTRRAVVRIPAHPTSEDDLDAWEKSTAAEPDRARPLFPGRREHAAQQQRWREARSLVTQGLAAERNDEFEVSVSLLERALELSPPNAANIHARLAVLAMEHLGDLDLAEEHARATENADPHRPHGHRLLRRIKRLRARGIKIHPRAKKKAKPRRTQRPKKPEKKARIVSGRALIATILALVVLGLIGWNVHRYLLPLLDAPAQIDVRELATLVPAIDGRLRDQTLFVTTSEAWESLTTMEKTDRLKRLAAWAYENHGVREIVVADTTPVLRARVRGNEVVVFDAAR